MFYFFKGELEVFFFWKRLLKLSFVLKCVDLGNVGFSYGNFVIMLWDNFDSGGYVFKLIGDIRVYCIFW